MDQRQLFGQILTYGLENKKKKHEIMAAMLKTGQFDPVSLPNALKGYEEAGLFGYEEEVTPKAPDLSAASAVERQSVADIDSTIQLSREAKDLLSGISTGIVAGRLGRAKQVLPGGGDKGFNKLDSKLSNIKANFMKALSGAAVSEQEVQRLSKFLPDVTDQEEVIKIKLEALENELANRKKNILKSLGIESEEQTVPGFQEAIDFARQNPSDPKSQQLVQAIRSGKIDPITGQKKSLDNQVATESSEESQTEPDKKGFFARLGDIVSQRRDKAAGILNRQEEGKQDIGETLLQGAGQIAGLVSDTAFETGKTALSALTPDSIEKPIVEGAKAKLSEASQTKAGQFTMEKLQQLDSWAKENPRAAANLEAIVNLAEIIPVTKGATLAGKSAMKATKATGKAVGKGVSKTGKAIGKTGEFVTAQAYGLKPETVRQIIEKPGMFSKSQMDLIDRNSVFDKVKSGVEKRLSDLSETGKEYQAIKDLPNKANVSEKSIVELLDSKGIKVSDGKIKVDLNSDIQLSKADTKGLEDVLELIKGKDSLSAKEVLNLRTRLSALSAFGEGKTDASKLIAKELRKKVDEIAKAEIPGLADLDAKFAPEVKLMKKVKKEIFNADGTVKDSAISKIANLTGKGKEQTLERLEKVIPGIREDVNILKAIEDIEYAKGQKVGTYIRTGLGVGGGLSVGGPVGAILGAVATSPQVGVSLLRAYGKAKGIGKGMIDGMIDKMKAGKKLLDKEADIMNKAFAEASKKAASKYKKAVDDGKISAGLSMKNIGAKDAQFRKTYERLSRQWDKATPAKRKTIEKAIRRLIDNSR